MASCLCISVRFLQEFSHGRDENGEPEWPPSPLRLAQALVAAGAGRWNERRELASVSEALRWLEMLTPPRIIAARAIPLKHAHRLYVPDNVGDKVAKAWARGRDASIADYRTEKDVRPVHLDGDSVHYVYSLSQSDDESKTHVDAILAAARSITHLGWGIDMAVGDASIISTEQAAQLQGRRWHPSSSGGTPLRTPKPGTLDDLTRKHADFLDRLTSDGFRPVPPLRVFDVVHYRREDEPLVRPYRVFELRTLEGDRFRYPHRRLIHIAGMVRHLAIEAMKNDPPSGIADDWVETYVAGHCKHNNARPAPDDSDDREHRQLSYVPLPSTGHLYADPGVRRVMIVAPVGDDAILAHVARRLAGLTLEPLHGDEFAGREPPLLVPVRRDNVARFYSVEGNEWCSFTPVILPGHDSHKSEKTRALIERALIQSGIEQPCEFEWASLSRFPKSFSSHKYGKDKQPQGYFRPEYLQTQTAVHLTLRFKDDLKVPGPLTIGAGRHCGFGLMAHPPK